ncbi:hypothetical protein F5Y18DRAFT_407355 [Xylariaceae sp. FL1019]|nr:hypothetical protein F5Y18DRAFT_407355 [Xylariaceae sp. FL1019]
MTPPQRSHSYRSKSRTPEHHHHHPRRHHHSHGHDDASSSSFESETTTDSFDESTVPAVFAWSESMLDPDGRFMYQTRLAPDGKYEWKVSGSGNRPQGLSPFPENHMAQLPYASPTANYSAGYHAEQAGVYHPQYPEKNNNTAHAVVYSTKGTDRHGEKRSRHEYKTIRQSKTSNHAHNHRNNRHDSEHEEKRHDSQHHHHHSHHRSRSQEYRGNQRPSDSGIRVENWFYRPQYSYRERSRY